MSVIHSQPQNREIVSFTDFSSLHLRPDFSLKQEKQTKKQLKKYITLSSQPLLTTKYTKLQEANNIPSSNRLLNANFKF